MTFKDLFSRFSFAEIKLAFVTLWRGNSTQSAGHLDFFEWARIYQSIQALQPNPTDCYIRLSARWEGCTPMIDMNCAVYNKKGNRLICPMACYPSWAETAGMEIVVEEDVEITPQELTVGLLWEITYFGGTEEMVRKNLLRPFHCWGGSIL